MSTRFKAQAYSLPGFCAHTVTYSVQAFYDVFDFAHGSAGVTYICHSDITLKMTSAFRLSGNGRAAFWLGNVAMHYRNWRNALFLGVLEGSDVFANQKESFLVSFARNTCSYRFNLCQ